VAFLVKNLFDDHPDHEDNGNQNCSDDDKFHKISFHAKLDQSRNSLSILGSTPQILLIIPKFACLLNLPTL
jgi:hypothetical protein